jgi:hypothetical protein
MDCPRQYIGQTGRPFKTRLKKHIRATKYNRDTSTYAQHILDTGHTYGNMKNTTEIINIAQKGRHMNTLEKFCIYCAYRNDTWMRYFLIPKIHYLMLYTSTVKQKIHRNKQVLPINRSTRKRNIGREKSITRLVSLMSATDTHTGQEIIQKQGKTDWLKTNYTTQKNYTKLKIYKKY